MVLLKHFLKGTKLRITLTMAAGSDSQHATATSTPSPAVPVSARLTNGNDATALDDSSFA
uniref:Uncharacterized protein n=1 Tax=Anopheles albimanus TaxID=7167 RepID=A0A182FW45_ANOAL